MSGMWRKIYGMLHPAKNQSDHDMNMRVHELQPKLLKGSYTGDDRGLL